MRRRNLLLAPLAAVLVVTGGEPARKPSDYPVQIQLGKVVLCVENLGPSIPTPSGGLYTKDYLTIEVALFVGGLGQHAVLGHPDFALRINGAKTLIRPDTPGAVAASLKYPDWEERRHVEATAGMGDANVILGRPPTAARFPGDRRQSNPIPQIENPTARKADGTSIDELVQKAALPEGDVTLPASGCLYFPYHGKMKAIKKLELVYEGPLGEASVRVP